MKHIVRRALAVAAGAALALTGVVAVQTPAAAYGPTANSLGCRIYFSDAGTGTSPTTWADTYTLTTNPASPKPGQSVTVSFTAATGSTNGPVALTAGSVPVSISVGISGAQTGTVTLNQSNYPTGAVAAYTPLGGFTATGSFVAGAQGAVSLTVKQVKFANTTASTYCSGEGDRDHKAAPATSTIVQNVTVFDGGATITSITGQTAVTAARATNTINFSVTGLEPSATLTASLKDSSGGGTGEGSGTGSTDANGAGTGSIVVPAGPTTGTRTLAISDGTNTILVSITILGTPTVTITPSGGGAGTAISVKGTDWNPGSAVIIGGYQALTGAPPPPATTDATVTATATATGGISSSFTVNDTATAYIGAVSGRLFALAPWTASADACTAKEGNATTGDCDLKYELSETVTGGSLSMSRGTGSSTIIFTGVTLNGEAQVATGSLQAINVTDNRGSTLGWELSAEVTDFTGVPGGTIPASALTWTPSCTDHTGATNASVAVAGSSAVAVNEATLCSGPASTAGTVTGGSFDAKADLSLTVPAIQLAGTYTATLTLTLS
ncbi:WxL domain-containing protein [Actinoplanes sp. CA-015351]|uniref:WxL domain-containing protein n=1 Tax=Actinoplanes sp. CA-015351 TaxID=3239897 RepID=UPI003D973AB8